MAVALGLVTTTIVGGTLAATTYQASTQAKGAKIDTKKLSISIVDETETVAARKGKNENSIVIQEAGMQGEVKSYNNAIYNDGNYELYTRVTIYKTWKDAPSLKAEMITLTEGSDWIKKEIDDEQIVLYYKKPLAPGEKSSSFLTGRSEERRVGKEC